MDRLRNTQQSISTSDKHPGEQQPLRYLVVVSFRYDNEISQTELNLLGKAESGEAFGVKVI